MSNSYRVTAATLLLLGLLAASCGRDFQLDTPASFSRFEETSALKMITAKGVRLRLRQVENETHAPLTYWVEAMETHMLKQGYLLHSKERFETVSGIEGSTLELVIPYGSEDWMLAETIFVVDDEICLVEVAGPVELFEEIRAELKEALTTFIPN